MSAYRSEELFGWVEPWLTDAEFAIGEQILEEAAMARLEVPTGDHWA